MGLQPPHATYIGEKWVDPITAHRFEWDGEAWRDLGLNADLWDAEHTKGPHPNDEVGEKP